MYICILNNYTNLLRFISFKNFENGVGINLIKKIFESCNSKTVSKIASQLRTFPAELKAT